MDTGQTADIEAIMSNAPVRQIPTPLRRGSLFGDSIFKQKA